jgi:type IV pilus assembly protein PilB
MIENGKKSIDEILLEKGILNIEQLKKVWSIQRESGKKVEDILVELQYITGKDILNATAVKLDMDYVDLKDYDFRDYSIPVLIDESMANRYCMIPIEKNGDSLIVAMKDPSDIFAVDDARLATGLDIKPVLSDPQEIEKLIKKVFVKSYAAEPAIKAPVEAVPQTENAVPEIENINNINTDFTQKNVSDMQSKSQTVFEPLNINISEPVKQMDNVVTESAFIPDSAPVPVENKPLSVPKPAPAPKSSHIPDPTAAKSGFNKLNTHNDNISDKKPGFFKERLGNQLVRAGVITQEQLDKSLDIQTRTGKRLGEILSKEGYINKKVLYEFLEKQLGIPHVDLDSMEISDEMVRTVSENIERRHKLIPIGKDNFTLKVAMSDPMNIFSVDDLRLATGMEIIPFLADEEQIVAILNKHYDKSKSPSFTKKSGTVEEAKKEVDLEEEFKKVSEEINVEISQEEPDDDIIEISDVENAPIVKMVNIIFNKAIASKASDIHMEPYEDCVMIRYRVDGQLLEVMKYDKKILPSLVARVKIISGLNIAEKRVPQDGRIALKIDEAAYDMRVSVLPTMFGEKVVIRIADKAGFNVSKKELGFFQDDMEKFDSILSHPHGIVLVTGPTGSGKSTTLYTALKELCKPNVNILTVEDPVESTIRGINQVQVNTKAGLTFAAALRSFLRQDPDIIMVGEIRDGETAEIAIRAAITGHLVLSTLHTNDAASSITRMIDMGIEPFLISSSVVGVIAQRLVRRLCPKCKVEYEPPVNELEALKFDEGETPKIYMPKGCPNCNNTGYRGRIAIYEIMTISPVERDLISKNVTSDKLKEVAINNGMKTLRDNCARLVKSGVTSVEEMFRVTYAKE